MIEDCGDEGIGLENAADFGEIHLFVFLCAVCSEACHGGEVELLAGVFVELFIEANYGLFPLLYYVNNLRLGDGLEREAKLLAELVVSPGPFVVVIVLVHGVESGLHGLQVFLAFTDAGEEGIDLILGGDEAGDIDPHSGADWRGRTEHLSHIVLTGAGGEILEAGDDRVAKEFDDGSVVITDALAEGGVADFGAVVGIDIGQFTRGVLEVPEELCPLYHLLDGEGGEEVVIDAVQSVRVLAGVALGPFLGVADGAYASEVHAGDQVRGVLLLDEIGERQVCGIRVGDVAAHHKGKRAYAGRPEDI